MLGPCGPDDRLLRGPIGSELMCLLDLFIDLSEIVEYV